MEDIKNQINRIDYNTALREAREREKAEVKKDIAKNLIGLLSLETISTVTGLTIREIQKIEKDNK